MIRQIFVLGCPRSGTTLLSRLLAKTQYGAPVESHFITKYYKRLHLYGDISKKDNFLSLLNDILQERPVMQWGLSFSKEEFFQGVTEYTYSNLINNLMLLRKGRDAIQSWGDKTPNYILDLDAIYSLFPQAKYIYIVRDGRDVALSLLERNWGPNNVFECAHYWRNCNNANPIIEQLNKDKQLYFLKYEELLEKPEGKIPEIFEFLGDSFPQEYIDQLIASIRRNNTMKWRTKMSEFQIRIFENIAADVLNQYKYTTTYDREKLNPFVTFFYKVHTLVQRILFLIKINLIDGLLIKLNLKKPFAE